METELTTCPADVKLDPRVKRTRKLLEDAMRALLHEKSYAEISVGDITERATVNRATFYAHFEDKQHLTTTMIHDDVEAYLLEKVVRGTPFDGKSLLTAGIAIFEFLGRLHQGCPKAADELGPTVSGTVQKTILEFFTIWLERSPDAMRFFPGAHRETVASVLSWSLYGGALRWSQSAKRPPAASAAREIVSLLMR